MTTHRKCNRCQISKPLDEFHKSKRFPLGRQYRCKACNHLRPMPFDNSVASNSKENAAPLSLPDSNASTPPKPNDTALMRSSLEHRVRTKVGINADHKKEYSDA